MIVGIDLDNYQNMLIEIWATTLYNTIRHKSGKTYGYGFLEKKREYARVWINNPDRLPGESILRLRKKNECVYCDIYLEFIGGVGDHVVGKTLDSALWMLPCCTQCNSSKGKMDLVDWWVRHKKKNIVSLKRDILSIFVRGKYRVLDKQNKLGERPLDSYYTALNRIKNSWDVEI
jgi:hypothetical protein